MDVTEDVSDPLHLRMVLAPNATPASKLLLPRRLEALPPEAGQQHSSIAPGVAILTPVGLHAFCMLNLLAMISIVTLGILLMCLVDMEVDHFSCAKILHWSESPSLRPEELIHCAQTSLLRGRRLNSSLLFYHSSSYSVSPFA